MMCSYYSSWFSGFSFNFCFWTLQSIAGMSVRSAGADTGAAARGAFARRAGILVVPVVIG
jgi:hypothetical protein